MSTYTDTDYQSYGANNMHSPSNCGYVIGTVRTYYGLVEVYAQGDERNRPHTRLSYVMRGRIHERQWKTRYTQRRIVTLAKEFAAEMHRKLNA